MFLVFMLLLFQTKDAFGDEVGEDVCAPIVIDSTASRTTVFNEARAAYMRGCHTAALSAFETFTSAPPQPVDALHLKGLVFLGEVAYKLGDRERSLQSFQMVLDIQPDYKISLIDHDPEAVSLFNLARALPRQKPQPEPLPDTQTTDPRPLPLWAYAPFGIPQLREGRVAQGTAHAVLQVAGASLSIGMFIHISQKWDRPFKPKDVQRANTLRFGVQWPATALFWGSYIASHIQARKAWKNRTRKQRVALDVRIQPDGAWVAIHVPVL